VEGKGEKLHLWPKEVTSTRLTRRFCVEKAVTNSRLPSYCTRLQSHIHDIQSEKSSCIIHVPTKCEEGGKRLQAYHVTSYHVFSFS